MIKARLLIVCDVNLLKCVARSQYGNGVFAEPYELVRSSAFSGPVSLDETGKGGTPNNPPSEPEPVGPKKEFLTSFHGDLHNPI